ncbi:unnamed protein product, partial [Ectocarpus sp. 13 AM-2016]
VAFVAPQAREQPSSKPTKTSRLSFALSVCGVGNLRQIEDEESGSSLYQPSSPPFVGSMSSAGLDAKLGRVTVTVKREESGLPEGEEEEYCTPHGTEVRADSGVSEVGCTD